jgi:hypothetical protein
MKAIIHHSTPFRTILGAALLSTLCLLTAKAAKEVDENAILSHYVAPRVNNSTYLDINGEASIDLAILINDEGMVDDWITLRTNDHSIITAIRNVISQWRFHPSTHQGEPAWSYRELHIRFEKSGSIVNITPMNAAYSMFNTLNDNHILVVPFQELDRIPVPVAMENPMLHKSLLDQHRGRTVKFEFFIDEKGKVRMPIVKESDAGNQVTAILLESLLKWEFEPPMKNGRRVATKAVIPFVVTAP